MSGIVMKHYKSDTSSTDQLYQYLTDHKHDQDTLLKSKKVSVAGLLASIKA